MTCEKCEEITERLGLRIALEPIRVAYYRVGKANIALIGCDEHIREAITLLRRGHDCLGGH
jgi:hypothetical protein